MSDEGAAASLRRDDGRVVEGRGAEEGSDAREHLSVQFAPLGTALPIGVLASVGLAAIAYVNATAAELFGRPERDLLGAGWESAVRSDDRAELVAAMAMVLDTGVRQRVLVTPTAAPHRRLELTLVRLGPTGAATGWLATVDDVSERLRQQARLAFEATHDDLTHLPNRALLLDRLRLAARRLERAEAEAVLAVLFVDLDDFKGINDRFGHAAGDHVLRTTAARLMHTVRAGDTVARLGGDEFVAVCELRSTLEVEPLVERVHAALSEPVALRGEAVATRASVGVLVGRPTGDPEALLSVADEEMYRRKAARRARDGDG